MLNMHNAHMYMASRDVFLYVMYHVLPVRFCNNDCALIMQLLTVVQ